MAFPRFTLCAFLIMGCSFDSSVPLSSDALVDAGPGGFAADCSSFVPGPCGECGTLRCSEGTEGTEIDCVGTLDRGSCDVNQVCSLDAHCETAEAGPECQPGEVRPCGECADEVCVLGQWTGQCEARHQHCDDDEYCMELDANNYRCEISCSTVGHRTPCDAGPGDAQPIPDFVLPGTRWYSQDFCDEDDECLECICFTDFSGNARVDCDYRCQ